MSSSPPPDQPRRQQEALGGADAVEKTTYVTGRGTEPERQGAPGEPVRKGAAGTAPNATWAIIVFLFVGAVLVYVLGWGR